MAEPIGSLPFSLSTSIQPATLVLGAMLASPLRHFGMIVGIPVRGTKQIARLREHRGHAASRRRFRSAVIGRALRAGHWRRIQALRPEGNGLLRPILGD